MWRVRFQPGALSELDHYGESSGMLFGLGTADNIHATSNGTFNLNTWGTYKVAPGQNIEAITNQLHDAAGKGFDAFAKTLKNLSDSGNLLMDTKPDFNLLQAYLANKVS